MNRDRMGMMLACLLAVSGEVTVGQAGPGSSPALTEQLEAARIAFNAGKYRDAANAFKKANKLQGDSCYPCWLGMAAVNMKTEDYKAALQSADKAVALAQDDSERAAAHNLKGNIFSARAQGAKEFVAAEEEYRTAAQLNRTAAVYHLNCATAMIRQSKDEAAKQELEACLAANPAPDLERRAQTLLADPRRGRENFAPDFKVKVLTGEAVSLQQFAGKVLVMDFWATWCPPCRESVPELRDLTRKYPAEKLILISVSADEDENAWHDFVGKKHMDWLQYRDSDHQLIDAFNVDSYPTYLVIDGEGIIRQRITGLDPQASVVHRLRATLQSMPQLSK